MECVLPNDLHSSLKITIFPCFCGLFINFLVYWMQAIGLSYKYKVGHAHVWDYLKLFVFIQNVFFLLLINIIQPVFI